VSLWQVCMCGHCYQTVLTVEADRNKRCFAVKWAVNLADNFPPHPTLSHGGEREKRKRRGEGDKRRAEGEKLAAGENRCGSLLC
jgi:hypothetical protein